MYCTKPVVSYQMKYLFVSLFIYSITRRAGRPRKNVSRELLENLLRLKVPISEIASFFDVTRPVIYKAMREFGINHSSFSDISDDQLRDIVNTVKEHHPQAGEIMVQGHLRAQGVHVQRERLRSAIHQVDPVGAGSRRRPPIRQRVYSVPCPNYIWHIDGNHKLIRWRMVLHHAVDGFSRLVVFGMFSNNNRASTVFSLYQAAFRKYGRPFRVRTDHGGENVDIWHDMVSAWGENARSVVVRSSVHNQRIKRHNRATNEQLIAVFKEEFYELERQGILDPLNDTDLFCLHYVYLPRINKRLTEFIDDHNNHNVSTEGYNSPAQLFWVNLHLTAFQGGTAADAAWRGVNVSDLMSSQSLPHVQVPDMPNPLDDGSFLQLQRVVDALSSADGVDLYRRTVAFVAGVMQN